jgi:hypothetical protein
MQDTGLERWWRAMHIRSWRIKGLIERLPPLKVSYEYVSDVSLGALNSAIIAMHLPGNERAAELQLR